LVRTQHLPPPAKTARSLRKRGPAGRFLLVTPCIGVRHCGSMRGSVHVHMVYTVRAKLAVRITARFADPRPFRPVTRAPDCSPDWYMPCTRSAVLPPSCPRQAAGWSCSHPGGRGRLPDRPTPSHQGCHAGGEQVRAARRRVEHWLGCVASDAARGSGGVRAAGKPIRGPADVTAASRHHLLHSAAEYAGVIETSNSTPATPVARGRMPPPGSQPGAVPQAARDPA